MMALVLDRDKPTLDCASDTHPKYDRSIDTCSPYSEDNSRLASRKYAHIVQKLGFKAKFSEFKIQDIVRSCDVKFPISLEGLAYKSWAV